MSGLLEVQGISKRFGGVRAVDECSLRVDEGTLTGLIGPNGSGKTTVFNIVTGYLKADAGRVRFAGRDVTGKDPGQLYRQGLTRTFQQARVFPQLTVLENLLVAAPNHRGESLRGALLGRRYWIADERREVARARELLARFSMSAKESDYAGSLSGGQKRLIEIMRALMLQPRLLLLDEPMSGVHPSIIGEIATYLEGLRDGGLTILIVEHELHMIERLCNPVIVMAQGKVIGQGSMIELRRQREIVDAYLVG